MWLDRPCRKSIEQALLEAAVRFKGDDFADECEWRAVYIADASCGSARK
jgi:hypothetical protein